MEEFNEEGLRAQLISELASLGIVATDEQAAQMVEHLRLVIDKNKVVNLTRIVAPGDAVTLHLVDSLVPLQSKEFKPANRLRFVDIGTGAGFPGIPIGIMTGMEGVLLDSVGKKVNAVNEFIDAIGLANLKAVHMRAEELALKEPRSFDFILARAVAQSNVLVEYASPLLKNNGCLVLEKANITDDEISHAKAAAKLCGLQLLSISPCELPHDLGHREVLIFKKVRKSSIKLPRQNGMAKNHPLG